eukprot:8741048-Alexandrium_andersonii.AAC.1
MAWFLVDGLVGPRIGNAFCGIAPGLQIAVASTVIGGAPGFAAATLAMGHGPLENRIANFSDCRVAL